MYTTFSHMPQKTEQIIQNKQSNASFNYFAKEFDKSLLFVFLFPNYKPIENGEKNEKEEEEEEERTKKTKSYFTDDIGLATYTNPLVCFSIKVLNCVHSSPYTCHYEHAQ